MAACCNQNPGPPKDISVKNICASNTTTARLTVCNDAFIGGSLLVGGAGVVTGITAIPPTPGLITPGGGLLITIGGTTTTIPFPAPDEGKSSGVIAAGTFTTLTTAADNTLLLGDADSLVLLAANPLTTNNVARTSFAETAPKNGTLLNLWATAAIQLTVGQPAFNIIVTLRTSPPTDSTGSSPVTGYTSSSLSVTLPIPASATLVDPTLSFEINAADLIDSLTIPAGTKIILEVSHTAAAPITLGAAGGAISAGFIFA